MPLEYYLGGAVAIILLVLLLVLLVSAFTGKSKRSARRLVVRESNVRDNKANDELTRQVARAADALEALLVHLKASGVQPAAPMQQTAIPQPSSRAAEARAPIAAQEVAARPVSEPIATRPTEAEPTATEASAQTSEQKPHRIKLSMFGR